MESTLRADTNAPGARPDGAAALDPALVHALRAARRIAVLTGAGVSAESGIPTFRDPEGIWASVDPEEVATPEAFAADPARVWGWYAFRRRAMAAARPNTAHAALVELERRSADFTLITQNVDGLHAAAGSRTMIELHGSIQRARCTGCAQAVELPPPDNSGDPATSSLTREAPPRCVHCGADLRPDVVWFGESLALPHLQRAVDAATAADLFLSVGTSGLVEPAASLPFVALESHARVVEVNPEPTPLSDWAHHVLRAPAGAVLPALVAAAWPAGVPETDFVENDDG